MATPNANANFQRQATLGADAVSFTTHPGRLEGASQNRWTGSGLLPRAAQVKNVALVIYKIEKIPAMYGPVRQFFTHAWLPRDHFDEVVEQSGWIFARKDNGYLALRSQRPYRWQDQAGENCQREVIVEGSDRQNSIPGGSRSNWAISAWIWIGKGTLDRKKLIISIWDNR